MEHAIDLFEIFANAMRPKITDWRVRNFNESSPWRCIVEYSDGTQDIYEEKTQKELYITVKYNTNIEIY